MLGPWCKRYDRRHIWSHRDCTIMPSPWQDREQLHRSADYCSSIGDRVLPQMADYLNSANQVSFDERYWRILIGPWLSLTIDVMYDRYRHISDAERVFSGWDTVVRC